MNEVYHSNSLEQTHDIGVRIGRTLKVGDCLCLIGDLGAGKTALTRGLAEGFGVEADMVSSPTYVLMQEYPAGPEDVGQKSLFHLDLYRMIEPDAELADLGLDEMLTFGAAVVEWAERAKASLPANRMEIIISITGPNSRTFTLCSA